MTSTGTVFACPGCGLETRRRYVPADALNDARAETAKLREGIGAARSARSQSFGGGMVPFDSAYFAAVEAGASPAEASRLGVDAVLDAFIASLP